MAVTLGAVTSTILSGNATTTGSFVSTNQPLYVRIAAWSAAEPTGVTYGGTALTKVADTGASSGGDYVQIWRLASPTAGTASLVVTYAAASSQAGNMVAGNTTGQTTGTLEGTPQTAVSATTATSTSSVSLTGAVTGDLTIAAVSNGNGAAITPSASGGGAASEDFDSPQLGEGSEGFKATDATTSVSASWAGATSWAIAVITLKAPATDPFPAGYRLGRFQPPNRLTLLAR